MSKTLVLMLFTLLLLSGLVMGGSVFAQSVTQPAVPEFTLEFIPSSYNVTTTDPYTGVNVTQQIDNNTINIVIKNPFNYSYSNMKYYLFYNVRVKGHFSEEWDTLYHYHGYAISSEYRPKGLAAEENSEYATTSYPANYPPGAQLDFQVEAVPMYYAQVKVYSNLLDYTGHYEPGYVIGKTSNWSTTQTFAIPPTVTLLLPLNGNFSSSDVPLTFVVDGYASQIQYSLDGGDNMTIIGNTTLTGLPNGYHNLAVYATDEAGNTGASEIISFTVDEPPEPFPTSLVIATVIPATVVLVGIGLLVYRIKRK